MREFYSSLARRGELIVKANEWKGTPFRAHGKAMGIGVDCVHLAAEIYKATGFLEEFLPGEYEMDNGQHTEFSRVIEWVEAQGEKFRKLEAAEVIHAGDLLCFRIGKIAHHVGIATGPLKFVHVHRGYDARESLLKDPTWRKRLVAVYRPMETGIDAGTGAEVGVIWRRKN